MKTSNTHDGQRKDGTPSHEHTDGDTKSFHDSPIDETFQGSEFLDDALRMHEQPLGANETNEQE